MSNEIYIHYGHKKFDVNSFIEISNHKPAWVKPYGGLWASNINAKFGWKDWCEEQRFRECSLDNSFKFKLKENTRILKIDNSDILKKLPIVNAPFKTSWINLDFEKLRKNYDVIEFLISEDERLYWDLYGWDCDSLLVLNKEVIEQI